MKKSYNVLRYVTAPAFRALKKLFGIAGTRNKKAAEKAAHIKELWEVKPYQSAGLNLPFCTPIDIDCVQ